MQNSLCAIGLFCCLLSPTQAAIVNYNGDITYHNDIVRVDFIVNNISNLTIFTDSRGLSNTAINSYNFDPYLTLWDGNGNFIAENDDIDFSAFNYDSSLSIANLSPGNYFFTVTASVNAANTTNYSEGFHFDMGSPITIGSWNQDLNPNDPIVSQSPANQFVTSTIDPQTQSVISATINHLGAHWSANLDLTTVAAIPLPASIWLFASAIAGYLISKKRNN
ncbi:MAG: DVUA0089 family protein [Methylococcales bacterium]|nr:DVUA0089 family protein [Methylococcales bacterium]